MPQIVACGECGKKFRIPDDKAGKRIKCGGCGGVITVPQLDEGDPWDTPAYDELEPIHEPASTSTRIPPVVRLSSGTRTAVKRPQKKRTDGSNKRLLIAGIVGGALFLLAFLSIGGFFAFRYLFGGEKLYFGGMTGYAVELAWVPADANFAFFAQPSALLNSDIAKSVELEKKLWRGDSDPDGKGKEFIKSLDLIMIAGNGSTPGKPQNCVAIWHFNTAADARDRFPKSIPTDQWQSGEAGGKSYWRYTRKPGQIVPAAFLNLGMSEDAGGSFDIAMYATDARTIVTGTEATIKSILSSPYSKTPLRVAVSNLDTGYELVGTGMDMQALRSGMMNLPGANPVALFPRDPAGGARGIKAFTVSLGVSTRYLAKVEFDGLESSAVAEMERDLQKLKSEFDADEKKIKNNEAALKGFKFVKDLVDGASISKSGTVVTITLRKPSNFAEGLKSMFGETEIPPSVMSFGMPDFETPSSEWPTQGPTILPPTRIPMNFSSHLPSRSRANPPSLPRHSPPVGSGRPAEQAMPAETEKPARDSNITESDSLFPQTPDSSADKKANKGF